MKDTDTEQTGHLEPSYFIEGFRDLTPETVRPLLFRELESEIENAGFELANANTVRQIFDDSSLFCRSEDLERILHLLQEQKSIVLENTRKQANICSMSSADGFRTALTEGFGNRNVGGKVTAVLTFSATHITNHGHVPAEDTLWQQKPDTARVSIVGEGEITSDDVLMLSIRFPSHLYPESLLNDKEAELLDEAELPFVVRHYTKNKTTMN